MHHIIKYTTTIDGFAIVLVKPATRLFGRHRHPKYYFQVYQTLPNSTKPILRQSFDYSNVDKAIGAFETYIHIQYEDWWNKQTMPAKDYAEN